MEHGNPNGTMLSDRWTMPSLSVPNRAPRGDWRSTDDDSSLVQTPPIASAPWLEVRRVTLGFATGAPIMIELSLFHVWHPKPFFSRLYLLCQPLIIITLLFSSNRNKKERNIKEFWFRKLTEFEMENGYQHSSIILHIQPAYLSRHKREKKWCVKSWGKICHWH